MTMKLVSSNKATSPASEKLAKAGLQTLLAREDIGFTRLPDKELLWMASQELGLQIRSHYKDAVVVGIGGSVLGAQAINQIFEKPYSAHQLYFCDNLDSAEFDRLISRFEDVNKVAWIFVSKTGATIETLATFDYLFQLCDQKDQFLRNTFFITEKRSNPLFDLAQKHQRPILEVPLDVGGRYSVLSPVGMLPAAFLGLNTEDFRQGAKRALEDKDLIVQVAAQALDSFNRGEWITLFWFYSSWMRTFGGWLQQLWAESLAKSQNRLKQPAPRASTPLSAIGACDQHSLLQQVMEGAHDKLVIFSRFGQSEKENQPLQETNFTQHKFLVGKSKGQILAAEAEATSRALTQQNISTVNLWVEDLSAVSVGYLFMFWQLTVGCIGESLNINAFDQPGVELGKRLAREILQS
jgi:glucose-6-phosphate isomerase